MELTREQIITMSKCGNNGVCSPCFRNIECQLKTEDAIIVRSLATALLAEMDKPKVWEGAHEWQDRARVKHYSNSALCAMDETFKDYTRTLPKSRIDEIAEEVANTEFNRDIADRPAFPKRAVVDIIKSAILKDREERGKK